MNFLNKVAVILATVGLCASAANACPNGLRAFNKKLEDKETCVLEGTYTGDLELSSSYNYILLGPVFIGQENWKVDQNGNLVPDGDVIPGKITINSGVKVFALNPAKDTTGLWADFTQANGQPVEGNIKSFLSVTRDSRIEILGQKEAPVTMTSAQGAHLQTPGDVKKSADWGGLVLNGKAKSNKCKVFEGCVVAGEANTGFYGGDDDFHDSGIIQFLQVEYGGDRIDDKKELNGITFNAIGLGTVIENIAVLYNSDDCIEFFGGAVTARNIFCYKGDDDGVDTTDGARIFLQNGIVVMAEYDDAADENDRHALEADSSKSEDANERLRSHPVLVNFSFVGGKNTQGMKLRRGTDYKLINSVMTGFDLWCLNPAGSNVLNLYSNIFTGCANTDEIANFTENTFYGAGKDLKTVADRPWVPRADSELLGGAVYVEDFSDDLDLQEAFEDYYEEVDYMGAVGAEDWTSWIVIQ